MRKAVAKESKLFYDDAIVTDSLSPG
jgi:hypothetical protein